MVRDNFPTKLRIVRPANTDWNQIKEIFDELQKILKTGDSLKSHDPFI